MDSTNKQHSKSQKYTQQKIFINLSDCYTNWLNLVCNSGYE